ncbi:reverse transcriptase [Gossypium australe]|uniref:Reverse transcriptase n=1 Tax=Gossypium australe TaxID=47621 RepID=A0A5B6V0E0_9ROSI|nr:reverse transcriptase [Gossypium australe]
MKGRYLNDNVLLAQELVNSYIGISCYKCQRFLDFRISLGSGLKLISLNQSNQWLLMVHKILESPKCKNFCRSHLCFANDLLVFTKGNLASIQAIKNVLGLFYQVSILQINSSKSELFNTSLNNFEKLVAFKGYKEDHLDL